MGAKVAYTLELHSAFLVKLKELGFVQHACDAAGIPYAKMRSWMRQGERGIEPYDQLLDDIRRVRTEIMGSLRAEATAHPGGAKWLLEKMDQRVYGGRQDLQGAVQALIDAVLPRMSESAGAELLDALESHERELAGEPGVSGGEAAGVGETCVEATAEVVEPARLGRGTDTD